MVAIPLDKTNYNKVSKYADVIIFKEFYPKTKNVSYYLKDSPGCLFTRTFLTEESSYPLTYVTMRETVCPPFICDIKTRLILCKFQVFLVIA